MGLFNIYFKTFNQVKLKLFWYSYLGYFFYSISRKSIHYLSPFLVENLNITKSQIGIILSVLSISYGLSKFINGLICDFVVQHTQKYFVAGLFFVGVINLALGFFNSINMLIFFAFLLGIAQGICWPSCAKMIISTFTKSECGIAWSFCSTANPIGGAIAAFMIAYIASNYNWELGFIIPGLLSMIAGIWLFYKNPYENSHRIIRKSMKNKISMKSFMKLVYTELLCNKLIWILSISYYFIYLIRTAFSDWLILFLIEQKNYMISNALGYACCFELGGVLGMILSGVISDLVLNSNRVKLSITSYILLIIIVASIYFIPVTWKFELYFLIFFLGVCIFCITTLIGLAAAEITEGRLASSANGLVGMFSYIGAGVAGYPLGLLIEVYGWQYFVFSIVCSCVIALVILKQLSTL